MTGDVDDYEPPLPEPVKRRRFRRLHEQLLHNRNKLLKPSRQELKLILEMARTRLVWRKWWRNQRGH